MLDRLSSVEGKEPDYFIFYAEKSERPIDFVVKVGDRAAF
jgi:hypothetical protein